MAPLSSRSRNGVSSKERVNVQKEPPGRCITSRNAFSWHCTKASAHMMRARCTVRCPRPVPRRAWASSEAKPALTMPSSVASSSSLRCGSLRGAPDSARRHSSLRDKVICERACATQAAFARAWCSRLAAARIRLLNTTACRNRAERGRAPPRPRNIAEARGDTVTFGAWHGHRKQFTWDTVTMAHHGARNVLF